MEAVDLGPILHPLGNASVMRGRVVRAANTRLGVAAHADIVRVHQCGDARDVGLEGQHLHVPHQIDVLLKRFGHSERHLRFGRHVFGLHHVLQAALDLADVFEVLVEAGAVGARRLLLRRATSLVTASSRLTF